MPHLTHAIVIRLAGLPVGEGAQRRPVRPGEGALQQEVLEPNPANLTSWNTNISFVYFGGFYVLLKT